MKQALIDSSKIRWQCRRGMLELDMILLPFFEEHFDKISSEYQNAFVKLLAAEDQELFEWFMGRACPQDNLLASVVDMIRKTRCQV